MSATLRTTIIRHIVYGMAFWLGLAFVFATATYLQFIRVDNPQPYWGVWEHTFIGYGTTASVAPLIFAAARFQSKAALSLYMRALWIAVTIATIYLYYVFYMGLVYAPYRGLSAAELFAQTSIVAWVWDIFTLSSIISVGYAYGYAEKIRENKLAAIELEKKLATMEATLSNEQSLHLRQRLGSHFVLNALSNIIAFVRRRDIDKAMDGLYLLSDILRSIAHHNDEQMTSLDDELDFLEKYLAFQSIRYPSLNINWHIGTEARKALLPSHILQPLLENAFKHGMGADGTLKLSVTAKISGKFLEIEIKNSTDKRNSSTDTSGTGEGLTLTELRLQKHYGNEAVFDRSHSNGEHTASIQIPYEV